VPAVAGAVYSPIALIVPTVAFPPATLSTDHVTAVFEVFATVAANWAVAPGPRFATDGFKVTVTPGGVGLDDEVFIPWQPARVRAIANPKKQPESLDEVETIWKGRSINRVSERQLKIDDGPPRAVAVED